MEWPSTSIFLGLISPQICPEQVLYKIARFCYSNVIWILCPIIYSWISICKFQYCCAAEYQRLSCSHWITIMVLEPFDHIPKSKPVYQSCVRYAVGKPKCFHLLRSFDNNMFQCVVLISEDFYSWNYVYSFDRLQSIFSYFKHFEEHHLMHDFNSMLSIWILLHNYLRSHKALIVLISNGNGYGYGVISVRISPRDKHVSIVLHMHYQIDALNTHCSARLVIWKWNSMLILMVEQTHTHACTMRQCLPWTHFSSYYWKDVRMPRNGSSYAY